MTEAARRGTIPALPSPYPLGAGLPALYDEPKEETFVLDGAAFLDALGRIGRLARAERLPSLAGLHVRFEEGAVVLTPAEESQANGRPEAAVPGRIAGELTAALRAAEVDELEVGVQEDRVVFHVNGTTVSAPRVDGRGSQGAGPAGSEAVQVPLESRTKRMRPSLAQRFTAALDEVLAPVFLSIDNIHAYLDPRLAPSDFLPWLAGWVGLTLDEPAEDDDADERLHKERRNRALVARAVGLYAQRGTATGLAEEVEFLTGVEPEIVESGGVSWSTTPGAKLPGDRRAHVLVRLPVPDHGEFDLKRVSVLVDAATPAHVTAEVEVIAA